MGQRGNNSNTRGKANFKRKKKRFRSHKNKTNHQMKWDCLWRELSQEISRDKGEEGTKWRGVASFFKREKKHRETIFQPMENNTSCSPQQINNHSNRKQQHPFPTSATHQTHNPLFFFLTNSACRAFFGGPQYRGNGGGKCNLPGFHDVGVEFIIHKICRIHSFSYWL